MSGQGAQVPSSAKAIEVRNTMMLTELYYYYGNHQAAKAGSRPVFSFSPTTEKAACTAAVISASDIRRNRETAAECEASLDRPSTNELAGESQKSGTARVCETLKPPLTRPRR